MAISYVTGKKLVEKISEIINEELCDPESAELLANAIVEKLGGELEYTGEGNSNYGAWNSSSVYC